VEVSATPLGRTISICWRGAMARRGRKGCCGTKCGITRRRQEKM